METDVGDKPPPPLAVDSAPTSRKPSRTRKACEVTDVDALSVVVTDIASAECREQQAACAGASLGYCGFGLKDAHPKIRWGKINNRPINEKAAGLLLNNLEVHGLHNAEPDTVIRIGVKKDWIDFTPTRDLYGKTVLDLPEFKLTPAGEAAMCTGLIIPFSGNHRKHALKEHYKLAEKRLKKAELELKKLSPENFVSPTELQINAYNVKTEHVEILRTHLLQAELWGTELFDLGELITFTFLL